MCIRFNWWWKIQPPRRWSKLSLPSTRSKVRQIQRWISGHGIHVWCRVSSQQFQPIEEKPPWPWGTVRRLLRQVTRLNANEARTEWLSIWLDRGVSWVPDDWTPQPQEGIWVHLCWRECRVCAWNSGQQGWCLTLPRGRSMWLTPVQPVCRWKRVDMRCVHQVTGERHCIPLETWLTEHVIS